MIKKYSLKNLHKLKIRLKIPSIIFLKGDLWAWKTTLTKHIINNLLWYEWEVKSPTYTYYNKFELKKNTIYHFDLYRLKNYDEFFAIWWEEIFDNNNWIIIVEWSEIIEKFYKADLEILLKKCKNSFEREIELKYKL